MNLRIGLALAVTCWLAACSSKGPTKTTTGGGGAGGASTQAGTIVTASLVYAPVSPVYLAVADNHGTTIAFLAGKDDQGVPTAVTGIAFLDGGLAWRYDFDQDGHLTHVQSPAGTVVLRNYTETSVEIETNSSAGQATRIVALTKDDLAELIVRLPAPWLPSPGAQISSEILTRRYATPSAVASGSAVPPPDTLSETWEFAKSVHSIHDCIEGAFEDSPWKAAAGCLIAAVDLSDRENTLIRYLQTGQAVGTCAALTFVVGATDGVAIAVPEVWGGLLLSCPDAVKGVLQILSDQKSHATGGAGGGTAGPPTGLGGGGVSGTNIAGVGGSVADSGGGHAGIGGIGGAYGSGGIGGAGGSRGQMLALAMPPPLGSLFTGDPHLLTFDGLKYDCQPQGEETVVVSTSGDFEVQTRTIPLGAKNVAVVSAVAARVQSDRVAFYLDGTTTLNGVSTTFAAGNTVLSGGGVVWKIAGGYAVVWPDTSQLRISFQRTFLGVRVFLPLSRGGQISGLLGNANGLAADDITVRGGATTFVSPVPFADFYHTYVESWRIAQSNSLFDYPAGTTTDTFTDRTFPHQLETIQTLNSDEAQAATTVCQAAGITADWMDACVLDVAASGGDAEFATALSGAPVATTTLGVQPSTGGGGSSGQGGSGGNAGVGCACAASICSQGTLIVLTPAAPSITFTSNIVAPGNGNQAYTKYDLDVSGFPAGGTIKISGMVGSGVSAGSFDLFPACTTFPTTGRPTGTLGGAYDVAPSKGWSITPVKFAAGDGRFHFGSEGNWSSAAGSMNTSVVTIEVTSP